jgi:hypothetical protein
MINRTHVHCGWAVFSTSCCLITPLYLLLAMDRPLEDVEEAAPAYAVICSMKNGMWLYCCCLMSLGPYYLEFCVKFYVVDPAKLREELTRYLFFLQIKRDLLIGKLVAPPRIAAEIFSLVLQCKIRQGSQYHLFRVDSLCNS